ncbi:MAG TPA: enolase C-terminal domain-like protein [Rhodanobacteraceae bacterium]|nr:enolase C-terminal domain-like protein [Rhodanobacteraceae bacterium]
METVALGKARASAYQVPTDAHESDGTLEWDSTTLVLVEIEAGGKHGIGYSYADNATATLVNALLAKAIEGRDAMDIPGAWAAMLTSIRNLGRGGISAMAVSAVDNALWDLKAKLLDLPLFKLLGEVRDAAPVYGSGGFCSYSDAQLRDQLGGWADDGIGMVKMKVGREPQRDPARAKVARKAIGDDVQLFVDANGAYARKQALQMAEIFVRESDVRWFEEPVTSDDLTGLRLLRDRAPAGLAIAAGEYGYTPWYFRRMLAAGAVDVLQADATRCAGISGFMQASALCEAFNLPLSAHCAPALHAHPACAARPLRHIEYFHDHVRIENLLFDGVPQPERGALHPDAARPGFGLEFRHQDAERYRVL